MGSLRLRIVIGHIDAFMRTAGLIDDIDSALLADYLEDHSLGGDIKHAIPAVGITVNNPTADLTWYMHGIGVHGYIPNPV